MKPYIEMDKEIIKFDNTEIEEYKFHQYKSSISINDIGINELVVFNKFPFDNKILNISLATKMMKKVDLYAYSFQEWVCIKDIVIKLNVCIFW